MPAGTKEYKIVINGLETAQRQVDALSDAIQFMEERIKRFNAELKSSTSSGSSSRGSSSRLRELSEEDKLLKQIQQTESQIRQARTEEYQSLLASKDLLKQARQESEQRAAAERLSADTYANSMKGMKQQLSDIKKLMETTDVDSMGFQDLVKRANDLNTKLSELEQSYGQFNRNVGNYKSAAEGFKQIEIEINGQVRGFNSMREALRAMRMELMTMSAQGLGNTTAFTELRKQFAELQAASEELQTSSRRLDDLTDALTSLASVGSITQGFSTLFGIDDDSIDESIQRLLALQNVVQGLEALNNQLQRGELFGNYFNGAFSAIDKTVDRLFNVRPAAQEAANAVGDMADNIKQAADSTNSNAQATDQLAQSDMQLAGASQQASTQIQNQDKQTKALNTTTKATSTVAVKAANTLKLIGKGLLIGAVLTVISKVVEAISDLIKRIREGDAVTQAIRASQEKYNESVAETTAKLVDYQARLKAFNGTQEELKPLLEEGGQLVYNNASAFTSADDALNKLTKDLPKYIEYMGLMAKQQELVNQLTKLYTIQLTDQRASFNGWQNAVVGVARTIGNMFASAVGAETLAAPLEQWFAKMNEPKMKAEAERLEKVIQDNAKKVADIRKELGIKTIEQETKNGRDLAAERKRIDDELARSRINNMQNAFRRELAEIERERNVRIDEAKKTGYRVREQIEAIEKETNRKRIQALSDYMEQRRNTVKQYEDEIRSYQEETYQIAKQTSENNALNKLNSAKYEEQRIQQISLLNNGIEWPDLAETYWEEVLGISKQNEIIQKFAEKWGEDVAIGLMEGGSNVDFMAAAQSMADKMKITTSEALKMFQADMNNFFGAHKKIMFVYEEFLLYNTPQIQERLRNSIIASEGYYKKMYETEKEYYERTKELRKDELKKTSGESVAKADELLRQNMGDNLTDSYLYQLVTNTGTTEESVRNWIKANEDAIVQIQREQETLDTNSQEWIAKQRQVENILKQINGELVQNFKNGTISFKEFMNQAYESYDSYSKRITQINKLTQSEQRKNDNEFYKNTQKQNETYYSQRINQLSDVVSQLSQHAYEMRTQMYKYSWDFVDKDAKKTEAFIKELRDKLSQLKVDVQNLVTSGNINLQTGQNITSQIEKEEISLFNLQNIGSPNQMEHALSQFRVFYANFGQIIEQSLNGVMGVMQQYGQYQDSLYQDQIDKLQDYIDKYAEKLQEQQEITQQHASNIDSIEGELETARGSRRQHLIDQLNAEIAAQRQSAAEEKKLQKEQEKAQKQQDKIEEKRKKGQKKRDIAQATVSTSLAILNALSTRPWWLAITQAAIAAAMGAAQIAIISKTKYAKGGLLEGPSHSKGGIPVGHTGIEVEGHEYVVNKKTTMLNLPLMEYVNKHKRKLYLDDFVDFYTTKHEGIKQINRKRYADGGEIPTLRTIDPGMTLERTMRQELDRPVVVQVVDIINRAESIRKVQTLAGL